MYMYTLWREMVIGNSFNYKWMKGFRFYLVQSNQNSIFLYMVSFLTYTSKSRKIEQQRFKGKIPQGHITNWIFRSLMQFIEFENYFFWISFVTLAPGKGFDEQDCGLMWSIMWLKVVGPLVKTKVMTMYSYHSSSNWNSIFKISNLAIYNYQYPLSRPILKNKVASLKCSMI